MTTTEYVVLYTHQKQKKAKVWQDGVLKFAAGGGNKKATLFDDNGNRMEQINIKSGKVEVGDDLESARHLITVEEVKVAAKVVAKDSSPARVNWFAESQQPSVPVRKPVVGGSSTRGRGGGLPRTGLLRKRTASLYNEEGNRKEKANIKSGQGFVPPRVVKKPRLDEEVEVVPIPEPFQQPIQNTSNLFSLYSKKTPAGQGTGEEMEQDSQSSSNIFSLHSKHPPADGSKETGQPARNDPKNLYGLYSKHSPAESEDSSNSCSIQFKHGTGTVNQEESCGPTTINDSASANSREKRSAPADVCPWSSVGRTQNLKERDSDPANHVNDSQEDKFHLKGRTVPCFQKSNLRAGHVRAKCIEQTPVVSDNTAKEPRPPSIPARRNRSQILALLGTNIESTKDVQESGCSSSSVTRAVSRGTELNVMPESISVQKRNIETSVDKENLQDNESQNKLTRTKPHENRNTNITDNVSNVNVCRNSGDTQTLREQNLLQSIEVFNSVHSSEVSNQFTTRKQPTETADSNIFNRQDAGISGAESCTRNSKTVIDAHIPDMSELESALLYHYRVLSSGTLDAGVNEDAIVKNDQKDLSESFAVRSKEITSPNLYPEVAVYHEGDVKEVTSIDDGAKILKSSLNLSPEEHVDYQNGDTFKGGDPSKENLAQISKTSLNLPPHVGCQDDGDFEGDDRSREDLAQVLKTSLSLPSEMLVDCQNGGDLDGVDTLQEDLGTIPVESNSQHESDLDDLSMLRLVQELDSEGFVDDSRLYINYSPLSCHVTDSESELQGCVDKDQQCDSNVQLSGDTHISDVVGETSKVIEENNTTGGREQFLEICVNMLSKDKDSPISSKTEKIGSEKRDITDTVCIESSDRKTFGDHGVKNEVQISHMSVVVNDPCDIVRTESIDQILDATSSSTNSGCKRISSCLPNIGVVKQTAKKIVESTSEIQTKFGKESEEVPKENILPNGLLVQPTSVEETDQSENQVLGTLQCDTIVDGTLLNNLNVKMSVVVDGQYSGLKMESDGSAVNASSVNDAACTLQVGHIVNDLGQTLQDVQNSASSSQDSQAYNVLVENLTPFATQDDRKKCHFQRSGVGIMGDSLLQQTGPIQPGQKCKASFCFPSLSQVGGENRMQLEIDNNNGRPSKTVSEISFRKKESPQFVEDGAVDNATDNEIICESVPETVAGSISRNRLADTSVSAEVIERTVETASRRDDDTGTKDEGSTLTKDNLKSGEKTSYSFDEQNSVLNCDRNENEGSQKSAQEEDSQKAKSGDSRSQLSNEDCFSNCMNDAAMCKDNPTAKFKDSPMDRFQRNDLHVGLCESNMLDDSQTSSVPDKNMLSQSQSQSEQWTQDTFGIGSTPGENSQVSGFGSMPGVVENEVLGNFIGKEGPTSLGDASRVGFQEPLLRRSLSMRRTIETRVPNKGPDVRSKFSLSDYQGQGNVADGETFGGCSAMSTRTVATRPNHTFQDSLHSRTEGLAKGGCSSNVNKFGMMELGKEDGLFQPMIPHSYEVKGAASGGDALMERNTHSYKPEESRLKAWEKSIDVRQQPEDDDFMKDHPLAQGKKQATLDDYAPRWLKSGAVVKRSHLPTDLNREQQVLGQPDLMEEKSSMEDEPSLYCLDMNSKEAFNLSEKLEFFMQKSVFKFSPNLGEFQSSETESSPGQEVPITPEAPSQQYKAELSHQYVDEDSLPLDSTSQRNSQEQNEVFTVPDVPKMKERKPLKSKPFEDKQSFETYSRSQAVSSPSESLFKAGGKETLEGDALCQAQVTPGKGDKNLQHLFQSFQNDFPNVQEVKQPLQTWDSPELFTQECFSTPQTEAEVVQEHNRFQRTGASNSVRNVCNNNVSKYLQSETDLKSIQGVHPSSADFGRSVRCGLARVEVDMDTSFDSVDLNVSGYHPSQSQCSDNQGEISGVHSSLRHWPNTPAFTGKEKNRSRENLGQQSTMDFGERSSPVCVGGVMSMLRNQTSLRTGDEMQSCGINLDTSGAFQGKQLETSSNSGSKWDRYNEPSDDIVSNRPQHYHGRFSPPNSKSKTDFSNSSISGHGMELFHAPPPEKMLARECKQNDNNIIPVNSQCKWSPEVLVRSTPQLLRQHVSSTPNSGTKRKSPFSFKRTPNSRLVPRGVTSSPDVKDTACFEWSVQDHSSKRQLAPSYSKKTPDSRLVPRAITSSPDIIETASLDSSRQDPSSKTQLTPFYSKKTPDSCFVMPRGATSSPDIKDTACFYSSMQDSDSTRQLATFCSKKTPDSRIVSRGGTSSSDIDETACFDLSRGQLAPSYSKKTPDSRFVVPREVTSSPIIEDHANLDSPDVESPTTLPDFQQDKQWIEDYRNKKRAENLSPALSQFRTPMIGGCPSIGAIGAQGERNLGGELFFPSKQEVESKPTPVRQVTIQTTFPSVPVYKQVITSALREHLNIMLFTLSKVYHQALEKADVSKYTPSVGENTSSYSRFKAVAATNNNPPCEHGQPSKIVQVRKDGKNKGRFFYSCNSPRDQQCKYFKWADEVKKGQGGSSQQSQVSRLSLLDPQSINTFFKAQSVKFYCECQFLRKTPERYGTKGFPAWARKRQFDESAKKKFYIKLSRKEGAGSYSKDDLWIVSLDLSFEPDCTFIAKSSFYGPNSSREVEIDPIAGFSSSRWTNNVVCHAILAGNVSSEFTCISTIQDHIETKTPPIISHLIQLDGSKPQTRKDQVAGGSRTGFSVPRVVSSPFPELEKKCYIPKHLLEEEVKTFTEKYQLNMDQASALRGIANMFDSKRGEAPAVQLIHGVFGAGKSYLLAVLVIFLDAVFTHSDQHTPGLPFPWKILISSTTNVAVDRILMGLLDMGFEDLVRVGSVKKIAKPVLPYSVHASGTDSQELKDLQDMLRSELTPSEKHCVRKSIEQHRLGLNKKKLSSARVVGATCAACPFPCMNKMVFPVVFLDECSQITEPSSLLPIARFKCEKLVLIGDPKQLGPTLQGSDAAHMNGLEQTLFDRLLKMGYDSTLLRTQYRCHPRISAISNSLFYNNQLIDGIDPDTRPPILPDLPTSCFYNVSNGKEQNEGFGSYHNETEVTFVISLIEMLLLSGIEPASIGVITLYRAQMFKLGMALQACSVSDHSELKAIQISTVDAFQGGEKDIIILSCVRTQAVGFIDSEQRTNVALTRAKNHLLIIGHMKNLSKNILWGKIINHCRSYPNGVQNSVDALKNFTKLVQEKREMEVQEKQEFEVEMVDENKKVNRKKSTKKTTSEMTTPEINRFTEHDFMENSIDDTPDLSSWERDTQPDIPEQSLKDVTDSPAMSLDSNCSDVVPTKPKMIRRHTFDASLFDEEYVGKRDSDDEDLPEFLH